MSPLHLMGAKDITPRESTAECFLRFSSLRDISAVAARQQHERHIILLDVGHEAVIRMIQKPL